MSAPKHTNLYAQSPQAAERKARKFYGAEYAVDGRGTWIHEANVFYYDLTRI